MVSNITGHLLNGVTEPVLDLRHRMRSPDLLHHSAWCHLSTTPVAGRLELVRRDWSGGRCRLLDRLRAQAEALAAAGPLQQAHRLAFAAEAVRVARSGGPDALAAWDASARAWESLGQPYSLARALARAAQAALDRGDRDAAAERLTRAAPLAEKLAAGPLCEQIGSLARRAYLGLHCEPYPRQHPGTFGLTARETEVMRLVAAGRSNREIAAELLISAKTASARSTAGSPRSTMTGDSSH